MLLIPGNHDLDRSRHQWGPTFSTIFKDPRTVADAFEDPEVRRHLLFPMQAYSQFVTKYLGNLAPLEPAYSFRHPLAPIRNHKVAIFGLNSAWMCGQTLDALTGDFNDYGRLVLGEHQLHGLLEAMKREQPEPEIVIAVMHHPFWWLSEVETRSRTEDALLRNCHFILRGHEHKSGVSVPTGTAGNCAVISAGAAYDRREYPNGYSFVRLDLREGRGHVYIRRYYDELGAFSRDIVAAPDEEMVTFTLPKKLSKPTQPEPRSRFGGDPWKVQSPATMEALTSVYELQHQVTKLVYHSAAVVVEANSLAPASRLPDRITVRVEFSTPSEAVYCHRMTVMWAEGSDYQGRLSWKLEGPGGEIKTIGIPVTPRDSSRRDLLLFFNPVLPPSTGPYVLEKQEFLADSMKSLRETGMDELYMILRRAKGSVPRVDLVLKVPAEFGDIEFRPGTHADSVGKGIEVTDVDELDRKYGKVDGFRNHCWRGQNVPADKIFAADVHRKAP
jgi:hypothetical protein